MRLEAGSSLASEIAFPSICNLKCDIHNNYAFLASYALGIMLNSTFAITYSYLEACYFLYSELSECDATPFRRKFADYAEIFAALRWTYLVIVIFYWEIKSSKLTMVFSSSFIVRAGGIKFVIKIS